MMVSINYLLVCKDIGIAISKFEAFIIDILKKILFNLFFILIYLNFVLGMVRAQCGFSKTTKGKNIVLGNLKKK